MQSTDYLLWLVICHLVADWVFQNEWMAINKVSLKHPASWMHGLIHLVLYFLVVDFGYALVISLIHILIDTRIPITIWKKFYKQTSSGEMGTHVSIWEDQVFHISILAIVALLIK